MKITKVFERLKNGEKLTETHVKNNKMDKKHLKIHQKNAALRRPQKRSNIFHCI